MDRIISWLLSILGSGFFAKIIKIVYYEKLRPIAEDYVNSTENTYDNTVLKFLDEIVDLFIGNMQKSAVIARKGLKKASR
jgi:hypothetical protein